MIDTAAGDLLHAVAGPDCAVPAISAIDAAVTLNTVGDAVPGANGNADLVIDLHAPGATEVHDSIIGVLDNENTGHAGSGHDIVSTANDSALFPFNSMFETVKEPGSGIVFNNIYESDVSAQYHEAIVEAENFLQQHFTDSVTLNVDFNMHSDVFQKSDGTPDDRYLAVNNWHNAQTVTYDQLKDALIAHATTADDFAAVRSLPADDPSHGAPWSVPIGMAENLGLVDPSFVMNPVDDTISLNPHLDWTYGQDAVATLIHEMTEGLFGRVSNLGFCSDMRDNGVWAPMDLFRYAVGPDSALFHDNSGGADGKLSYFSVDGETALTQFHNPIGTNGVDHGGDFADWASWVQGDAFGQGGPGAPGEVTDTDLRVLDVLGWTPTRTLPYGEVEKNEASALPLHGPGDPTDANPTAAAIMPASAHDSFHFDSLSPSFPAEYADTQAQADPFSAHLSAVVEAFPHALDPVETLAIDPIQHDLAHF